MARQTRWTAAQRTMAIRIGQQETSKVWQPHRSVMRFLGDYFPDEWEMIRRCHTSFRFKEDRERPGYYKRLPTFSCHKVPLCLICTKTGTYRRVRKAVDQIAMCTPEGERPRFVHIVQTAPVYDDGTGWGMAASKDLTGFGNVVWASLKEELGEGIGAIMSYQDFGERGFTKRHPHMDLTLNGWMLQDGAPVKTEAPRMADGGRKRGDDRIVKHAQAIEVGAKRGNPKFGHTVTGARAYWNFIKYQMRELVDLRKLDYNRDDQVVWWSDYKDNTRTKMSVGDFMCGFYEYKRRLGAWESGQGALNLHRRYGHLAKRSLRKTQAIMGGEKIPHGVNCPCEACGDWMETELTAEEQAMNAAFTVDLGKP